MKIALDTVLLGLPPEREKLEQMVDGKKEEITLRDVCLQALLNADRDAKAGPEKNKRFLLSLAIAEANKEYGLTAEDISLLKRLIGQIYTPLVVGRAYQLLEGEQMKTPKE